MVSSINASRWQMGFNSAFEMSFKPYPANVENMVSSINVSRWQMGFNSAFEGLRCSLSLTLLTWRIWGAPNNAGRWQMGFNSGFKVLKWPLKCPLNSVPQRSPILRKLLQIFVSSTFRTNRQT